MVLERGADCGSKWATIELKAPKDGGIPRTLIKWIHRAEINKQSSHNSFNNFIDLRRATQL
jgi:hypothetical protein